MSLPAAWYSASWPGPGMPARSGRLPVWMPCDSWALRSREPVYLTWTWVSLTQGWIMARNEVSSSPDQVPTTVRLPPMGPVVGVTVADAPGAVLTTGAVVGLAVALLEHAEATSIATTSRASGLRGLLEIAENTPSLLV